MKSTWFIVASKSGSTTEPNAFLAYFYERTGEDASRFIAVTDPGSSLDRLATERGFRAIFHGEPTIGGRFSALSPFGIVPAALLGTDLDRYAERARSMADACGAAVPVDRNPAVRLGAALGVAAKAGRDKLTFRASHSIGRIGAWVEQLVAESTGKQGVGICPVVDEPEIGAAGDDRIFVFMVGPHDADSARDADALATAGHPVVTLEIEDSYDLAGAFFLWEVATAVAGAHLGINPFDQPNVQESKDITAALIAEYVEKGAIDEGAPSAAEGELTLFDSERLRISNAAELPQALRAAVNRGDYVALCAFVDMRPDIQARLQSLRSVIGNRGQTATALGFGPRFLHSTGQLHKGGADNGVFLQITTGPERDAPVPDMGYTFGALCQAQALGDFQALAQRGRRVVRVHLESLDSGLDRLLILFGASH